jgi:uncharacterized membrane protein
MWPFYGFVLGHIATGAAGLILFWVVMFSRKGGDLHRKSGLFFIYSMLLTGSLAVSMSICTLLDPTGTHPHIPSDCISQH